MCHASLFILNGVGGSAFHLNNWRGRFSVSSQVPFRETALIRSDGDADASVSTLLPARSPFIIYRDITCCILWSGLFSRMLICLCLFSAFSGFCSFFLHSLWNFKPNRDFNRNVSNFKLIFTVILLVRLVFFKS